MIVREFNYTLIIKGELKMTTKEKWLGLPFCIILTLFLFWFFEKFDFGNSPSFFAIYAGWWVIVLSDKVLALIKKQDILIEIAKCLSRRNEDG